MYTIQLVLHVIDRHIRKYQVLFVLLGLFLILGTVGRIDVCAETGEVMEPLMWVYIKVVIGATLIWGAAK